MVTSVQHDQNLLSALAQSDEHAFAEIYQTYWKLLHDAAWKRLGDREQAGDVVQDIFVKLWDQRKSLSIDNLKAYLQTAVRYKIYNLIASRKVNDTYFQYLAFLDVTSDQADQQVLYQELQDQLTDLLDKMPLKRREVFDLRYADGLTTKEIAEKLNISQKTVQNQLIKATNSIKDILFAIALVLPAYLR